MAFFSVFVSALSNIASFRFCFCCVFFSKSKFGGSVFSFFFVFSDARCIKYVSFGVLHFKLVFWNTWVNRFLQSFISLFLVRDMWKQQLWIFSQRKTWSTWPRFFFVSYLEWIECILSKCGIWYVFRLRMRSQIIKRRPICCKYICFRFRRKLIFVI